VKEKDQVKSNSSTLAGRSNPGQQSKRGSGTVRTALGICALIISIGLAACSPATSTPNPTSAPADTVAPQPTATEAPTDTPEPTQAPAPSATSLPQSSAVNTALDPCQLIDSQEASTLAGAKFGKGLEKTTPGGLKVCTYGSQATNIFTVEVVQEPDVATAQADKAQFLADLQANLKQLSDEGLTLTQLPTFADGATMATASLNAGGQSVNGSAIGFLKGTVFFGFSDIVLNKPAPSSEAVQAEAQVVLGRLP